MSDIADFYNSLPKGRCKPCKYGKVVCAQDNYMFLGCYCRPYSGKRVSEIKDCPLVVTEKREGDGNEH